MSSTTGIPVPANRFDPGLDQICFSGWSCQLSSMLGDFLVLVAIGVAVGLIIASLAYIKSAKSAVEEEQSRTAAEREAFIQFGRTVADLNAQTSTSSPVAIHDGGAVIARTESGSAGIDEVKGAYRDTVMSVPHYEEDYNEPLEENMAVEFGRDITVTVANETKLTPVLQSLLVSKANKAAQDRQSFMRALARERTSILEAEESFDDIQSTLSNFHPHELREGEFENLATRWEELDELESQCMEAVQTRQNRIESEPLADTVPEDEPSIFEYVYQSLEVDYPILATATDILDQIQTSRHTLTRIASNRN